MEVKEKQLDRSSVHAQLSHTMGDLLTFVEASFSDKQQREAFKSMVKLIFQKRHDYIDEITLEPNPYNLHYAVDRGDVASTGNGALKATSSRKTS